MCATASTFYFIILLLSLSLSRTESLMVWCARAGDKTHRRHVHATGCTLYFPNKSLSLRLIRRKHTPPKSVIHKYLHSRCNCALFPNHDSRFFFCARSREGRNLVPPGAMNIIRAAALVSSSSRYLCGRTLPAINIP